MAGYPAGGSTAPVGGGPPGLGGGPPGLGNPGAPGGDAAAAEGGVSTGDLRAEILARIGGQVKQLITQARRDSEMKVRTELKVLNDVITEMDSRLEGLTGQLDEMDDGTPKQVVEQHTVAQALSKVEQQWGKELGKLKQELHQTIFAHNHNADLMKHQKDTLDSIRNELQMQRPEGQAERVKAQLAKVEQLLKGQQRQRKLEPLFHRLAALEQRIAWRFPMGMMPPMGGMPPGMAANLAAQQGLNSGVMGAARMKAAAQAQLEVKQQMAIAQAAAQAGQGGGGQGQGGNQQRGRQGGNAPGGGAHALPSGGAAGNANEPVGPQASEGPPKRTGEKAAFVRPTDEEVQARLAKAAGKPPAKELIAEEGEKKSANGEADATGEKAATPEKEEATA